MLTSSKYFKTKSQWRTNTSNDGNMEKMARMVIGLYFRFKNLGAGRKNFSLTRMATRL
jgi:hypothetical protein